MQIDDDVSSVVLLISRLGMRADYFHSTLDVFSHVYARVHRGAKLHYAPLLNSILLLLLLFFPRRFRRASAARSLFAADAIAALSRGRRDILRGVRAYRTYEPMKVVEFAAFHARPARGRE